MNRFPETHQALNKEQLKEMKSFLFSKLNEENKDVKWVNEIWDYIGTYPLYDEINTRLDILWNNVFNQAQRRGDFTAATRFNELLEGFINSNERARPMEKKLIDFRDKLSEQLSIHDMHQRSKQ